MRIYLGRDGLGVAPPARRNVVPPLISLTLDGLMPPSPLGRVLLLLPNMTRTSTDSATATERDMLESRPSFEGFRVRSPDEPRPVDEVCLHFSRDSSSSLSLCSKETTMSSILNHRPLIRMSTTQKKALKIESLRGHPLTRRTKRRIRTSST